ncbi:hypothetical protein [Chryseobacterium sediminis]|uniref:Uncharacterized protein n=1 Tax=Chryseobacterium sediminis TaxID=1679494 RepID=A0A5B2U9T2_9FLAO|nr:hypothetical protein [Chryseobacterium sediminis]KAA2223015.1 hypothetical protein FW780_02085 [Chryseobacterium sediminis]
MKLQSMTDFVLQQNKEFPKGKPLYETNWENEVENFSKLMIRYAEFIRQPLTLGMFVPIDENGELLNPPIERLQYGGGYSMRENEVEAYEKAKEKVLFEGFEFSHDNNYNTVLKYKTESSIKVELQFRKTENDVRLIINSDYIHECNDIERLTGLKTKPELTPSALKQIGL